MASQTQPQSGRSNRVRGMKFNVVGGVCICTNDVVYTVDSISGAHQQGNLFWSNIFRIYWKIMNLGNRDAQRLAARFCVINKDMMKFIALTIRFNQVRMIGEINENMISILLVGWQRLHGIFFYFLSFFASLWCFKNTIQFCFSLLHWL